ncbi:magnesium/cobalt transporter CorA [Bailinhaonella thermotolerans]|uniref:Magnesium transport protein CorA n=1 Tax=Bailinhaonella thermotolerans TaxID=1070861 RepID=A0A3A4B1L2_9ACTN|nr:magnesium/cobalt transporter CorA [Bailinhaonella thermotolerans]RJL31993.1 magnesium and cobalt transport protein CorA [Bailinhaonella thermotolerans]
MRPGITLFKPLSRTARTAPAPQPAPPCRSSLIDCAAYIDGLRFDTDGLAEAIHLVRASKSDSAFVWVGLHSPEAEELEQLAEVFGLHPLAVEDAVHAHQRPKLERYDDVLFVVLKTVRYIEHEELTSTSEVIETGEVMAFLGPDFVVTVRHGDHCDLRPVRQRLERSPDLLKMGPAAVLHAISDHVVDDYLTVSDAMQTELEDVEATVFADMRSSDIGRIYQLKRELIEMKRAVAPLTAPLRQLTIRRLVPSDMRDYFRDVEDHLVRVREQIDSSNELCNSILQATLAQSNAIANEDMRKISAWVAIIAVPTMVAGIYGMNFDHMPETKWTFGYPMVLGIMIVACALLYRGFRRNGWL